MGPVLGNPSRRHVESGGGGEIKVSGLLFPLWFFFSLFKGIGGDDDDDDDDNIITKVYCLRFEYSTRIECSAVVISAVAGFPDSKIL